MADIEVGKNRVNLTETAAAFKGRAGAPATDDSTDKIVTGTFTGTGNASTTVFNTAHGLGKAPSYANVVGGNAATAALKSITSDATNIIVTFVAAPGAGALTGKWIAVI